MTSGSWRLSTAVRFAGTHLPSGGVRAVPVNLTKGPTQSLGYGTAGGTLDVPVVRRLTIPDGTSETLNLYDGSLLDVFGQPAPFRTLRSVAVWVESGGDATGVVVGADGVVADPVPIFLTGTNPRVTVYPSGPAFSAGSPAGVAVDATHRNLKLTNAGAADAVVVVALAGGTT